MLRRNIDVKKKLVNGAIGYIKGFEKEGDSVSTVIIEFNGIEQPAKIKRSEEILNIQKESLHTENSYH